MRRQPLQALPNTPPSLSIGRRCVEHGLSFHWNAGQAPCMVRPDGVVVRLHVQDCIPCLRPACTVSFFDTTPSVLLCRVCVPQPVRAPAPGVSKGCPIVICSELQRGPWSAGHAPVPHLRSTPLFVTWQLIALLVYVLSAIVDPGLVYPFCACQTRPKQQRAHPAFAPAFAPPAHLRM